MCDTTRTKTSRRTKSTVASTGLSNRKKKKAEYAKLQKLCKKSHKAVYNKIIPNTSISPELNSNDVFQFWKYLITRTDYTAPGPDGLTVRKLNKIPVRQRCKLYSFWLLSKWVPEVVLISRTIFIPKEADVRDPS